jgi:hypothetical protein
MSNTQAPPPIAPVAPAARTGAPTVRVFAMHLQKKKQFLCNVSKAHFLVHCFRYEIIFSIDIACMCMVNTHLNKFVAVENRSVTQTRVLYTLCRSEVCDVHT